MPEHVPLHIGDREVQEYLDRFGFACCFNDRPVEIQAIGIEETETTTALIEAHQRENFRRNDYVAIAVVDGDIRAFADLIPEVSDLVAIQVDEMIFIEPRGDAQDLEGRAENAFFGCLSAMLARPREAIDVISAEALRLEDGRVGGGVLPDDFDLELGPLADLIKFERNGPLPGRFGRGLR